MNKSWLAREMRCTGCHAQDYVPRPRHRHRAEAVFRHGRRPSVGAAVARGARGALFRTHHDARVIAGASGRNALTDGMRRRTSGGGTIMRDPTGDRSAAARKRRSRAHWSLLALCAPAHWATTPLGGPRGHGGMQYVAVNVSSTSAVERSDLPGTNTSFSRFAFTSACACTYSFIFVKHLQSGPAGSLSGNANFFLSSASSPIMFLMTAFT